MTVITKLVDAIGRRGDDDDRLYQCQQCERRFARCHHSCPQCGCYRVERTEWFVD